jgi:hypothetical protein
MAKMEATDRGGIMTIRLPELEASAKTRIQIKYAVMRTVRTLLRS